MKNLPYWGEMTFIRFASVFFDNCMETVPGLRADHGELRARSYTQSHEDTESRPFGRKAGCSFSLPFGHGERLDIGTAEYHKLCPDETDSAECMADSLDLTLLMRNMLCRIFNAVGGDEDVMGAVQVLGIVGSGELRSGSHSRPILMLGRKPLRNLLNEPRWREHRRYETPALLQNTTLH